MNDFILFVISIFLAEIGDKTQLVTLSLATKTRHKLDVFWGVFLALLVIEGLSILFGIFLSDLFPRDMLLFISGIIFLIYGGLTFISYRRSLKDVYEDKHLKVIFAVFMMIFLAEMGDKTQIATIFFSATYPAIIVYLTVILVLSIMTLITIYLSHVLFDLLSSKTVYRISGTLFIILGLATIVGVIMG